MSTAGTSDSAGNSGSARGRPRTRLSTLEAKKSAGEAIVQLAVTNYADAKVADRLGIDIITASDVAGVTVLGRPDTRSVTLEEMCTIGAAVARGIRCALCVVTMPFWTYQVSPAQAVENAGRLIQRTGADAVECEVSRRHAEAVAAIVAAGIPVQAHIGLSGQRLAQLGGYRGMGKSAAEALELLEDGRAMAEAGCFSVLCELTSDEVTHQLAHQLPIPVISLGAGNGADGVSVVFEDLFARYEEHVPRHVKVYERVVPLLEKGLSSYIDEVRSGAYPAAEHSIAMRPAERERFLAALAAGIAG